MTANNPFTNQSYDLGVGDALGVSRDTATDDILRTAYTNINRCFVCSNTATHRVLAKKDKHTNAQIQNGLYICEHCLGLNVLDHKKYGIRAL